MYVCISILNSFTARKKGRKKKNRKKLKNDIYQLQRQLLHISVSFDRGFR